jgi:hypothetical protein
MMGAYPAPMLAAILHHKRPPTSPLRISRPVGLPNTVSDACAAALAQAPQAATPTACWLTRHGLWRAPTLASRISDRRRSAGLQRRGDPGGARGDSRRKLCLCRMPPERPALLNHRRGERQHGRGERLDTLERLGAGIADVNHACARSWARPRDPGGRAAPCDP